MLSISTCKETGASWWAHCSTENRRLIEYMEDIKYNYEYQEDFDETIAWFVQVLYVLCLLEND